MTEQNRQLLDCVSTYIMVKLEEEEQIQAKYIFLSSKTKQVAPLVADSSKAYFTTRQNPNYCNPPLYIAACFAPIVHLKYILDSRCALKRLNSLF